MKKLLPLLLCVPLIGFSQHQLKNNRKIKLIEEIDFSNSYYNYISFVNDSWDDDPGIDPGWTEYYYDYNGNLIKDVGGYMVGYDQMGGYDITTYEYDNNNQLRKEILFSDLGETLEGIIVYSCWDDKVWNITKLNYYNHGPLHKTNDFISEVEYDEWDVSYKESDNQIQVSVNGQWIMNTSHVIKFYGIDNYKILTRTEQILDNEYEYRYIYDSKNRIKEVWARGNHLAHCGDSPVFPDNFSIETLERHIIKEDVDPLKILSHYFRYPNESFLYDYNLDLREDNGDFFGEYFYDNNGRVIAQRYCEAFYAYERGTVHLSENYIYAVYRYNANGDIIMKIVLEDPLNVFLNSEYQFNPQSIDRLFDQDGNLIENKYIQEIRLFRYKYF